MPSSPALIGTLALLVAPALALADTPAFDRPGIAFSTTTLPAGSVAWEQGLPDFEHVSDGGDRATLYSANTMIRVGLSERAELQLASALYNHLDARIGGTSASESGFGDTRLAVKWALPGLPHDISWAALAAISFPSGERPFRAEEPQYDLGTTLSIDLDDSASAAFYINANYDDGDLNWTLSPTLGFAVNDTVELFVEAGAFINDGDPNSYVAGGGVTWMLTPTVQLDASANFGLNDDSPDVSGGIGFSVFIP